MCLVSEVPEALGSYLDQRVQIPGRLPEDLHRDRVGFGLVLDLAECVNAVPEYVLAVAQVVICILDIYA